LKNAENKGGINVIEVKEMTDEYVFDRCPLKRPLNPMNLSEDTYPGYGERAKGVRRRFFQEVKNKYGNCVLFAWNDDEIIGFLIFLPKTVARKIGLKTSPNDNLLHQTLNYVCMQLVSNYRKKGLGTKMVKSLITWAKNNGWKRKHTICEVEIGMKIGDGVGRYLNGRTWDSKQLNNTRSTF
jgi:GNAT superfamily N-acetyltransferase